MLQKFRGVVLRCMKHSDRSFIVDLYTETHGRMACVVPAARKGSMRGSLFHPMACVEFEAEVRPHASLSRMKEAGLEFAYGSILYEPRKAAIAFFVAEFLYRAVREEGENRLLYAYIQHSMAWLDACRADFANFHLVFLMRLSRFLGLMPNSEGYRSGAYFDLVNACFTSLRPVHPHLMPHEAAVLHKLLKVRYETMRLFPMNRAERNRCLEVVCEYYRLHLPAFPELKSLEVLKELFD